MRNLIIFSLFTFFHSINVLCQDEKQKNDKTEKLQAVNDYLQTFVKEPNQQFIIIENQLNPNEVIRIFEGNVIKDSLGNFVEKDGGVKAPLYSKKALKKMKKKYADTVPSSNRKNFSSNLWKKENFNHPNIKLENFEEAFLKLQKGLYSDSTEIQIFAFSEPIYYKNKNYLIIGVLPANSKSIGFATSYIVIMQKLNSKWVVIDKTIDYIMN